MGLVQKIRVFRQQTINVRIVTKIAKPVKAQLKTAHHASPICALTGSNKHVPLFARRAFKYTMNLRKPATIVTITVPHVQGTLLHAQRVKISLC